MNDTTITTAKYVTDMSGTNSTIRATIDGTEMFVPLDPSNRHYSEIMRQVEAGTLVIQGAE